MAEVRNFKMRVFFKKQGRLALLSHLEVARALERTVRRAGLPYAISQGFSPHMKISFGAALPVGIGGLRECFDLQLTRYVSTEEALTAFEQACVSDLAVTECEHIDAKAPAASVAYPVSTYRAKLSRRLERALEVPETVVVLRKRKEKTLVVGEYLQGEPTEEGDELRFTLIAKNTGSLRPDVFLKELLAQADEVYPLEVMRIRQETF